MPGRRLCYTIWIWDRVIEHTMPLFSRVIRVWMRKELPITQPIENIDCQPVHGSSGYVLYYDYSMTRTRNLA